MSKAVKKNKQPSLGHQIERPDGLIELVQTETDEGMVKHYRKVDTLALMLKNGSISQGMHDAGKHFEGEFALAFASGVGSSRYDGLPASTAPHQTLIEKNSHSAKTVKGAMDAVGGASSPAGSALWYVVGLGLSVREWSSRLSWSGKPINVHEAKGVLIAALGVLAGWYGYG